MLLIEYFDKGAQLTPDRIFLIEGGAERTYRQVQDSSHRIANALARAGVEVDERAAVYSHNCVAAVECLLGIVRRGCVWVSANTRNGVEETASVLNNTAVEVFFYGAKYAAEARRIMAMCPSIRLAVCLDGEDGSHPSLEQFTAGAAAVFEGDFRKSGDVVTLFSSGGTTGAPKGVMMTNLGWSALVANIYCNYFHEAPVQLIAAPLTHGAGAFLLTMASMGTINVVLPGFDAVAVMESIQRHKVTHLFLPPTAIYAILAHPDVRKYDYSSLRFFTFTGAPMAPDKIKEAVSVFGPVMAAAFGQTESGLNSTFFPPGELAQAIATGNEARLQSCGRVTPFVRVEVMDEEGRLLPAGERGELVVRGDQIMIGYWNNPEETKRASGFGWHRSGDIGYKDKDGWVFIVDRKRDMIISGGFNVFPAEIEKVVVSHPAVEDCIVVGVPDEKWGEVVTAVVQLKAGRVVDVDELKAFCRERLGGVKTPKQFDVWQELPRSPVGKLLRRKVRETYWSDRDRNV